MSAKKLYRQTMAEIAGITPVQLDYLVRIGAVAPDMGKTRKHYSYKEATFVLIAAQLVSFFSEQRHIVEVIRAIREYLDIPGCSSGRINDYTRAFFEAEMRESEGQHLDEHHDLHASHLFLIEKGYRSSRPKEWRDFMKTFCKQEGLSFDAEMARMKEKVREIIYEPKYHGFLTLHDFIMRNEYMRGAIGMGVYIHVAKNGDGSVETLVDSDTLGFVDRISWTIINCGKLFARLRPYAEAEFTGTAEQYLEKYGDG